MIVKLQEVADLCDILINKAKSIEFNEIQTDSDYYWTITSDEREDINNENPQVTVGSLKDDWESLNKVLEGGNIPTPVDFERLGNILTAIGEIISKSNKIL